MQITQGEVTLRDTRASDTEDEIRWFTTDNDWFYADTPWETFEPADPEELRPEAGLYGSEKDGRRIYGRRKKG